MKEKELLKKYKVETDMKTGVFKLILLAFVLFWGCQFSSTVQEAKNNTIDDMAITVSSKENRAVSFTNKEAAFYYTRSHENNHSEHAFFNGLTIAQKKIFDGYELFVNGNALDTRRSELKVYPQKMIRTYTSGIVEEFWMFDHINALEVALSEITNGAIEGIKLNGIEFKTLNETKTIAYFNSEKRESIHPSNFEYTIAVKAVNGVEINVKDGIIEGKNTGGFFIAVSKEKEEVEHLVAQYNAEVKKWKKQRENRLSELVNKKAFNKTDNDSLNLALKWLTITMDQLVSHQQGYGIYAGLPWFSEYWGRDEFISLPGACLVNGEFDVTRKILLSFAEFQDTISTSKYFGRVPNIVNPSGLDYHTTDGTPRFIIQLKEYVMYSGDKTIINELYDNVKYSIEGSLKNWTDKKGYLLHEDNETWMDARRNYDKMPFSPRGTRANDIQALWYKQLLAGVYFANAMDDTANAAKWKKVADKIKSNFEKDYTSDEENFIADKLDKNDVPEYIIRPNQLFAFELIESEETKNKALKTCWEELVYPWGVASLDNKNEFFHPFHHSWDNYHKDQAYHNGTIWLWLNGIAMQRMIEANQQETAYKLFKNMNHQLLTIGCVGGMAENMDAYPREGKDWPKLTGTYLQAWSNAEHLRIWYQYFLGIQPDMINRVITLSPKIPTEINTLNSHVYIGKGFIDFNYDKASQVYTYKLNQLSENMLIDIYPFETKKVKVETGNLLKLQVKDKTLNITVYKKDLNGEKIKEVVAIQSEELMKAQQSKDELLKGIDFCYPLSLDNHKVMKQKYKGGKGI